MTLLDFDSYKETKEKALAAYADRKAWRDGAGQYRESRILLIRPYIEEYNREHLASAVVEERKNEMKRASGILLPIFSLPSKYGIGCFSKDAYKFVDMLKEAGISYWQILPLGPTGYGDSPYQSFSTFAGNPYFIDLKTLIKEGLL